MNILYKYLFKVDKFFSITFILNITFLASVIFYFNLNFHNVHSSLYLVVFATAAFVTFTHTMTIYLLKNKEQEHELKTLNVYLATINDVVGEIRSRQHEFKNHLQTISALPYLFDNYESLSFEIKKYIGNLPQKDALLNLLSFERKVVSAFLYSKQKEALSKGFNLKIELKTDGFNVLAKDYELIEILGTLIDNAFDVNCDKIDVIVRFYSANSNYFIQVLNAFPYISEEMFSKFFDNGFTTKNHSTSNRGTGLFNLKNIVCNNYNGEVFTENISMVVNDESRNFVCITIKF